MSKSPVKTVFDQLALRFALYHLAIMAKTDDSRVGIGAKGMSGEGYKGHSFWDTEIFILPYFMFTDPGAAKLCWNTGTIPWAGPMQRQRNMAFWAPCTPGNPLGRTMAR